MLFRSKDYSVKKGHRQEFTEIVVDSIKIKVSKPKNTTKDKEPLKKEPLKTKKTVETKAAKDKKETSKTSKTTKSKKEKS